MALASAPNDQEIAVQIRLAPLEGREGPVVGATGFLEAQADWLTAAGLNPAEAQALGGPTPSASAVQSKKCHWLVVRDWRTRFIAATSPLERQADW